MVQLIKMHIRYDNSNFGATHRPEHGRPLLVGQFRLGGDGGEHDHGVEVDVEHVFFLLLLT